MLGRTVSKTSKYVVPNDVLRSFVREMFVVVTGPVCISFRSLDGRCILCGWLKVREIRIFGRVLPRYRPRGHELPSNTGGKYSVPLPTKPGSSLIIPKTMKILQRDLNRSTFVVWEMKRNVYVVKLCVYVSECVCSKIVSMCLNVSVVKLSLCVWMCL